MPVEYDFFLNGDGFMLQDGGSSVATVNNPPGLRSTGGNLLREFGQWTEEEWADFTNGVGQTSPSNNGFLHSSGDTLHGGWRLQAEAYKSTIESAVESGGYKTTGVYFVQYAGYIFCGFGNTIRILDRHPVSRSPRIISTLSYTYTPSGMGAIEHNWVASWFSADTADPSFPFQAGVEDAFGNIAAATIKNDFTIMGMAVFGDYIAVVICDGTSIEDKNLFYPQMETITNLTPNKFTPTGLYLLDVAFLQTTPPNPTQEVPVGCTGYFVYDVNRPLLDPDHKEPLMRYRPDYEAVGCKVVHGQLCFWSGHTVFYTSGVPSDGIFDLLPLEETWDQQEKSTAYWQFYAARISSASHFTDPLWWRSVSQISHSERITGMVGIKGTTMAENVTLVSTTRALYILLPADVFAYITDWGDQSWWNGIGCIDHAGDGYFPVGAGLLRITPTGQIIEVGLNKSNVRPNRGWMRHSPALVSVEGLLVGMSEAASLPVPPQAGQSGYIVTRVWGHQSQGWHPMASLSPLDRVGDSEEVGYMDEAWTMQAQGIFYDSATHTLYWATANEPTGQSKPDGQWGVHVFCMTVGDPGLSHFSDPNAYPVPYEYKKSGWLVLPPFDAGAVVLEKDWNSVAVYGSCFQNGGSVEAFYRYSEGIAEAQGCTVSDPTYEGGGGIQYTGAGWVSLGKKTFDVVTESLVEWHWPIPRSTSSRAIELKFKVERSSIDTLFSPHIMAVRLQHHDAIKDYYRFNISINLPGDCLFDRCRVLVPGYNVHVDDAKVRAAVCSVTPVTFTDVDGTEYYVRVETASRRIANPARVPLSGQRAFDITWSLVLTELVPDSLCDIPS